MSSVRIRKTIDSETLTLPELRPFIGRTVEIVIEEQSPVAVEFWNYAGNLPTTEAEFAAQREQFRQWRTDPRFEPHWPMIDLILARDFEKTRTWAEVTKAAQEIEDYDYQALFDQDACDIRDLQERFK